MSNRHIRIDNKRLLEDMLEHFSINGVNLQSEMADVLGIHQTQISRLLHKLRHNPDYNPRTETITILTKEIDQEPMTYFKLDYDAPFKAGDTNVILVANDLLLACRSPEIVNQAGITKRLELHQTYVSRLMSGEKKKLFRSTLGKISSLSGRKIPEYILTQEQADQLNARICRNKGIDYDEFICDAPVVELSGTYSKPETVKKVEEPKLEGTSVVLFNQAEKYSVSCVTPYDSGEYNDFTFEESSGSSTIKLDLCEEQ